MQSCNKLGVPLWIINRILICRINLNKKYKSFDITLDGAILVDGKYFSHIDLIYYDKSIQDYYIPMAS